ncbi:hypothetical protein AK830_g11728 [Neonectria ditissima]|uniref:Apple domain-containing protein n=1 Tax=Neonectria ditissima TaxID=78410 RepID=A0A0P7ALI4_9HYPO|nr:hypothetical protein AK830_g11728 [Neonectria ditissima]
MFSPKPSTFLALSALAAVVSADAPAVCSAVDPAPDGLVCGATGDIKNLDGRLTAIEQLSVEQCSNYCGTMAGCTTFQYRDTSGGRCVLFSSTPSDLGYLDDTYSWDQFYEMGCFECSTNAVVDIDFSTLENLDDFSMTMDTEDTFFFDTQTVEAQTVFRVLEATDSGSALVSYAPKFQLEADATYKLGFQVKSNHPDETDLSLLSFYVSTNDEIIFEYSPVGGNKMGSWSTFSPEFTVREVDAGEGDLSIQFHASGLQLDWFFSYIYLPKVA